MSIGNADLHAAIIQLWDSTPGLDGNFTSLWPDGFTHSEYVALHDEVASPGQPFPYCVMEELSKGGTNTVERMRGRTNNELREIREIPVRFSVHAKVVEGDSRTAKKISADLAAIVMARFGGHPTTRPLWSSNPLLNHLSNGNLLPVQYQTDFGTRTGEEEYQWSIDYLFRLDVPVAV